MRQSLMFIEHGEDMFRGFGRCYPIVIWDAATAAWWRISRSGPKDWGWGQPVTPAEAERLHPGCSSAPLPRGIRADWDMDYDDLVRRRPELFDDYDGPTFRKSPAEIESERAYWDSVMPAHMKEAIAERRRRLESK